MKPEEIADLAQKFMDAEPKTRIQMLMPLSDDDRKALINKLAELGYEAAKQWAQPAE